MILQLAHPWLPRKMVLGGLPWVAVLIWPVPDAFFAAEEADAALSESASWLISQLRTSYSGQNLTCFMNAMLKLLTGLLEMRHLLLDLLSSLALVMQLFFQLLECNRVLDCKVLAMFAMSGTLSDASVDDLYSFILSMMLLSMLLIYD